MAAACSTFWPDPNVCAHGACEISTCICDEGWSSTGDFSLRAGEMCDAHDASITALWVIALISSVGGMMQGGYAFYIKHARGSYKSWQKWPFVGIHRVTVYAFITPTLVFILSIIRLSDFHNTPIGHSPASTTVFMFANFSLFFMVADYASSVTGVVVRQAHTKDIDIRERRRTFGSAARVGVFVSRLCAFGGGIAPMFMLYDSSAKWPITMHYVCDGMCIAIIAIVGLVTTRALLNDISQTMEAPAGSPANNKKTPMSNDLKDFKRKIVLLLLISISGGALTCVNSFVFGLWPWFQRKSSYQVVMNWTLGSSISGLVGWSTYLTTSPDSASRSTGSKKVVASSLAQSETGNGVTAGSTSEVVTVSPGVEKH